MLIILDQYLIGADDQAHKDVRYKTFVNVIVRICNYRFELNTIGLHESCMAMQVTTHVKYQQYRYILEKKGKHQFETTKKEK